MRILETILMWHNETLNIWSHLFGSLIFVYYLYVAVYWEPDIDEEPINSVEKWPMYALCIGAIFCYGCSTFYHVFKCHSEQALFCLCRLDYQAIFIVIAGNNCPILYY